MTNSGFSQKAAELRKLLEDVDLGLSVNAVERVLQFYVLVLFENERQNLTRLISPKDFFDGHILDVQALLRSGLLEFPAMDLGSGLGVPGILAAVIGGDGAWVIAESEKRKAEFLQMAVESLELDRVSVYAGRGEDYLRNSKVSCVVARAVGPVDRIYGWLRNCSTWNNLVLLKGPGWDAEWKTFQEGKYRSELSPQNIFNYSTGNPPKKLRIVKLSRNRGPNRR